MSARNRSRYALSPASLSAVAKRLTLENASADLSTLVLIQADDTNLFYPRYRGERVRGYDALRIDCGPHAGRFVLRGPTSSQKPQSAQAVLLEVFDKMLASQIAKKSPVS